MHHRTFLAVPILASLLCVSASAQWFDYPTPGTPRTPDGKANLAAPTPRTPDGKPDLSGIWRGPGGGSYDRNVARDLKPSDIQPWAEALYQQRILDMGKGAPRANCLPDPFPYYHMVDLARFVQTPGMIVILYQGNTNSMHRTIFTDGRKLPEDPNPTWMGYSVGHWEGDTLVVDTAGFNDKSWLDIEGHPHTEALRITERFHRRDFGHMDFEMTLDDPKTFTRPITVKAAKTLVADTELLETICENEGIAPHLVGGNGFRLAPEVLAKYAGTYEIKPGREAVVTVDGESLVLHLSASGDTQNLAAQSEATFVGRGNGTELMTGDQFEFVKDASGAVTGLNLHARNGEQKAVRKGAAPTAR
jgi:hypothetical protein